MQRMGEVMGKRQASAENKELSVAEMQGNAVDEIAVVLKELDVDSSKTGGGLSAEEAQKLVRFPLITLNPKTLNPKP